MEAKTYWEKRCVINESVMEAVIQVLQSTLPPAGLEDIDIIFNRWNEALDKLDED